MNADNYSYLTFDNLPAHDPDRRETMDGDLNELSNADCVEKAVANISVSFATTDDPSNLSDLIANILHLAHSRDMDPEEIMQSAVMNFYAEAGPLPVGA